MKNKFGLFSVFSKLLGKDRLASSSRLLARLLRDEDGSYLIYGITMLPILIGVGGLAAEGSLLFYNHRTLQSAADAAAYSAAVAYSNSTSAAYAAQANAVVASYGFTLGTGSNQANVTVSNPPITDYAGSGNIAIQVSISYPQSSIFSGYFGFSTISGSPASATAVIAGSGGSSSGGGGNCVLALGNTSSSPPANAPDAIQVSGGGGAININAPGCGIFSNSNDPTAVALGGSYNINVGSLGTAGDVSITGSGGTMTLPGGGSYTQGDGTLSDPLASIWTTLPSTPAPPCTPAPTTPVDTTTTPPSVHLSPGRYCGLDVENGNGANPPSYTLTGGIYILDCNAIPSSASKCPKQGSTYSMLIVKDGRLTDNGAGSTLVFACSSCTQASDWPSDGMMVSSSGSLTGNSVSLTAMTSGSTAGYVMLSNSSMPLNTVFDTQSNPNVCLTGTVYVPHGEFLWGGTPATGCSSTCLQLIVNTIQLFGNSSFSSAGCTVDQTPGSGGAQIPIGSVVTLVD